MVGYSYLYAIWRVFGHDRVKGVFSIKKRFIYKLISTLLIITLAGCTAAKDLVPDEQKAALANSIRYIRGSAFDRKQFINTNRVEFSIITEDQKAVVSIIQGKEDMLDLTDWVFRIGDIFGHSFTFIVCDSQTHEIIGHIPIQ